MYLQGLVSKVALHSIVTVFVQSASWVGIKSAGRPKFCKESRCLSRWVIFMRSVAIPVPLPTSNGMVIGLNFRGQVPIPSMAPFPPQYLSLGHYTHPHPPSSPSQPLGIRCETRALTVRVVWPLLRNGCRIVVDPHRLVAGSPR